MGTQPGLDSAVKSLSDTYGKAGKSFMGTEEQQIFVAKNFLKVLGQPLITQMGLTKSRTEPISLVDLAGGTGVISQEVQAALPKDVLEKSRIVASDNSEGLVELMKKRIAVEGWVNTEARVCDAMNTGLPDSHFTHASIAMGLHLIPEPDKALQECKRILQSQGILGLSTPANDPEYAMWQPDIRDAFASFPFEAPFPEVFPTQLHDQGKWSDPDWVEAHLKEQGFKDVQSRVFKDTFHVNSVDDFFIYFGGMLAWVMNGWWSEETREAHPLDEVKGLTGKFLEERYGGKGWDLSGVIIIATGQVDK